MSAVLPKSAKSPAAEPTSIVMSEAQKKTYYSDLERLGLVPFWEIRKVLIPHHPQTATARHIWRIEDVRSYIGTSGKHVDVKGAERRALAMENPGLRGTYGVTQTMFASYQLVMPGEVAYNHRHSPAAFRFVIEGEGAHSVVAGEKFYLKSGDVLITPNMAWHDHGNESKSPVLWIDGLDIPLVGHFGATWKHMTPETPEGPVVRPNGDGLNRYASGVVPVGFKPSKKVPASPTYHYPYERTRGALEAMRRAGDIDACHGFKVRYINPTNGDDAFPTMSLFLQLVPKGFDALPYRSSDDMVYIVAEGAGKTVFDDGAIEWKKNDVFVVPCWHRHRHVPAGADAVLFSFSDRIAQEKLGLWVEHRADQPAPFE